MRRGEALEKVAADKLSLSLEEIVAASGAGVDRRTSGRNGRDTPYRNTAGRTHKPGASLQEIAEATSEEERVLKVGASTVAKTLAGAIAHVCRESGAPPCLLPLGAASVNQAIKGVCIARRYLSDDDMDLACEPRFRGGARDSIALHLFSVDREREESTESEEVTLTVAASSVAADVAGAVANKVREKRAVKLSCCGAAAVSNALFALAYAREYLAKEGIDLCAFPLLCNEELSSGGGETRTVVKLVVCVHQTEGQADQPLQASVQPPVRRGGRAPSARATASEPVRRGGRPPKQGARSNVDTPDA